MNWETSKKPLIIAHRGFTKNHLENTLEAVDEAIRLHVDGVEVDLRMTADGELVVYHDDTLQRLGGRPGKIEKMTLGEIREVRLKERYKIPTLSELLDLVGEKILLNLEIKGVPLFSSKVERRVLELLRKFHLGETMLVSSFHPFPLTRLKRMAPELKRGYLVWDKYFRVRYRSALSALIHPFSVNPGTSMITGDFVDKIHRLEQKIFAWNVNELHDMIRFVGLGVDGFFSDKPDLALKNDSWKSVKQF